MKTKSADLIELIQRENHRIAQKISLGTLFVLGAFLHFLNIGQFIAPPDEVMLSIVIAISVYYVARRCINEYRVSAFDWQVEILGHPVDRDFRRRGCAR